MQTVPRCVRLAASRILMIVLCLNEIGGARGVKCLTSSGVASGWCSLGTFREG